MIQYGDFNTNVNMDEIILLLAERYEEDLMDQPQTFHIRESYVIKSKVHNPDTTMYMELLSSKHADEYYKNMNDKIQIIMRRDTWEVFTRKSADDHNVLPGKWSFKCNNKPDWTIRKFKA